MQLQDLSKDRFLRKDPNQADQTKSPVYTSVNPASRQGNDLFRKAGRPTGAEEDAGAPQVLTNTVIVSCVIQTSALPSRVEMQGNDITFFDDTYSNGSRVQGDTSRIVFTHASAKSGNKISEGFIIEKRGTTANTYDNVLSFYGLRPRGTAMNYMYFGLEASGTNFETNAIQFVVNHRTGRVSEDLANGIFVVGGTIDGIFGTSDVIEPGIAYVYNSLVGIADPGYSVFLSGNGAGEIFVASRMLPRNPGIDIGSASEPFNNVYATGTVGGESVEIEGNITWTSGIGDPNGVVAAPVGSLYSDRTGSTGTTLYVKETGGVSNTGWAAK